MKLLGYSSILMLFLLLSCKNTENPTTDNPQKTVDVKTEEVIDSSAIEIVEEVENPIIIDVEKLLSKSNFDSVYHVPFDLDSNYIESIGDVDASDLSNEEVQYLSVNMVKNKPTNWSGFNIKTFIELDSMKINGTYDDYIENLDIGMMKSSYANIQQKIIINDSSFILLWSITYSSYEACPFSSGTVIYGTFFQNKTAYNTVTLGETSGGGDAPYWSDTYVTSQINSTTISTNMVNQNGGEEDEETGEEIIDKTDETFKIEILKSGFMPINK